MWSIHKEKPSVVCLENLDSKLRLLSKIHAFGFFSLSLNNEVGLFRVTDIRSAAVCLEPVAVIHVSANDTGHLREGYSLRGRVCRVYCLVAGDGDQLNPTVLRRAARLHRQPKVTLSVAPERSATTHASLSTNPECQAATLLLCSAVLTCASSRWNACLTSPVK